MSFKVLYRALEGAAPHIKRNLVRDEVLRLTGASGVSWIRSSLDLHSCRGFYISSSNTEHALVKQFGTAVVVVGRGQDERWERFIIVKELMHMLDGSTEATDSGDKFDTMLVDLQPDSVNRSEPGKAELWAFWKALAVLCPEKIRQELARDRRAGRITDDEIASKLKIPATYAPNLFRAQFERAMARILK